VAGAIIDIVQPGELQACLTAADIASQPRGTVGLAEGTEGVCPVGPQPSHGGRLEPAGSRCRINFLPAGLAEVIKATEPTALIPLRDGRGNALASKDPFPEASSLWRMEVNDGVAWL
jgi:hypothetical protein